MVEQAVIFGIEMMADIGIGAMAGVIAKACTPENASKALKACIVVGGVAAGGCVAENANSYIENYAANLKATGKLLKERRAAKKAVKEEKPIEVKAAETTETEE